MATETIYTGDGSNVRFNITFPFLLETDVKVSVSGVVQQSPAHYTINGTVVIFISAPPNVTNNVRIYRSTDVTKPRFTYSAGGAITAKSLNNNTLQALYSLEEISTLGAGGLGLALTAGDKGDVTVNLANDWTINNSAVVNSMLATDSVSTNKIINLNVTTEKIAANAVTMGKLGSGILPSNISVGAAQLTGTINGARLPDPLPAIDGSNLTGILTEATTANGCVYENNQTITSNYTVTNNKNAFSAGPITIASGVEVTIGAGEHYTIV